MTAHNAAAVADICRRLDGIPLALELAAARARSLSVESIAARLSDRFALLVGGDRTALPRQQTLRALIDWSHDLLTERERVLFRRLAVFAGGFSLEGAEALCAAGKDNIPDVPAVLGQLVEKSLVEADGESERYRFLETVREYAQDRLEESGEADQARNAHLGFYLAYVEKASPQLRSAQQGVWLTRLDLERENILAAHAWCNRGEAECNVGLRLVSSMRRYWMVRGLLELGHQVTVEAIMRDGAQARSSARCAALFDAGQLSCWMGRYGEGQRYLEESLSIARELGDTKGVAVVLQPLAMASLGQGNITAARGHLEEALALAQSLGNKREIAAALNALAQINRMEGDLDSAEPLYENVVALARELDDREIVAIGLLNLAMVSIGRGAGDRARVALLEAHAIAAQSGSKPAGQSVLEVCAGLGALRAHWETAAGLFGAAEAQTAQTGLRRDPTDEAFLAPLIVKARTAMGEAAFAASEAAGRALTYDQAMAAARRSLDGLVVDDPGVM